MTPPERTPSGSTPAAAEVNPHFESVDTWSAAEGLLTFLPRVPADTSGLALQSLRVHVRDHKLRALPPEKRTLEAHYGRFVLTQSRPGKREARHLATGVRYGSDPMEAQIAGREARMYELGPEPEPGDTDPRNPAIVVWHDADMFSMVASDELTADHLARIALSLYL